MFTRKFKDKEISLLGFGTMRFPTTAPDTTDIDEEQARSMINYALEHGVNYIDTAYMYHDGKSEPFLGKALQEYDRKSYYLATKMPVWLSKGEDGLAKIFEDQLQRLKTDYFDFYLCHNLNVPYLSIMEKIKAYDFLWRKKEEGLIKHLGFSFHDKPEILAKIVNSYQWEFGQIQLNYIDWDFQDAKTQYEILTEKGLPCIIMEPVRGGALASLTPESREILKQAAPEKSIASWAIRYSAQLPNVMTVLSGMSSMEQLQDNIKTITDFNPLDPQETEALDKAVTAYKSKKTIPCTGCRYCCDCSQGVDIAEMFKIYNNRLLGASDFTLTFDYEATKPSSRESNCTSCGECLDKCPQKIDIPTELANFAEELKKAYANS